MFHNKKNKSLCIVGPLLNHRFLSMLRKVLVLLGRHRPHPIVRTRSLSATNLRAPH